MKFKEYRFLVRSDLHRYAGNSKFSRLVYYCVMEPGFKYSLWMRTCAYVKSNSILKLLFPMCWLMLRHLEFKYGIMVPYQTHIESGFYIGHFGGIFVSKYATIGKNCNISHQVTISGVNRGEHKGYAVIGDNVYIGPGAKIIGRVVIGNNAAIGANCVVTRDVPENGVVVGVPGKVISMNGSSGYINRTDYQPLEIRK